MEFVIENAILIATFLLATGYVPSRPQDEGGRESAELNALQGEDLQGYRQSIGFPKSPTLRMVFGPHCPVSVHAVPSRQDLLDAPERDRSRVVGITAAGQRHIDAFHQDQRVLELEEIFVRPLPASFQPSGLAISESGTLVVVWSKQPAEVLLLDHESQVKVAEELVEHPLAAAFAEGDSIIEIIEARRHSLIRARISGGVLSETLIEPRLDLQSAAYVESGWFLTGLTTSEDLALFFLHTDGLIRREYLLSQPRPEANHLPSVHLTPAGSGVLMTTSAAPFTVVRADPDGPPRTFNLPRAWLAKYIGTGAGSLRRWFSLPTVVLDSGHLQTISDLTSDSRYLILYDSAGRFLRHTRLDVPIGFSASAPRPRILVGARRGEVIEIVGYTWRWSGEEDSQGEI